MNRPLGPLTGTSYENVRLPLDAANVRFVSSLAGSRQKLGDSNQSAGAGQLAPKLTVKIESQVWSTSWFCIAAEADGR